MDIFCERSFIMLAVIKKNSYGWFLIALLSLLLSAGLCSLLTPTPALAVSEVLEITGDGVSNPVTYTREQLEEMEQHQYVYSVINTWPTKKWYVGQGVSLRELLALAGIKEDAATITFTSQDSYTITLTTKELLTDKRYYFPHFKENSSTDGDGNIPGSTVDARLVEPIIALESVEGSDNPRYMNDLNTLLLMLGQRGVTEQTGNLFVKYLTKIEVSTTEPPQWDSPQANPAAGDVTAGTMVALSNMHMDDDKVYYTTDGSTPTINSPMYNWIAKRWWTSRADVLGNYNHPIGPINEDTIIKAVTIGPGKRDSEIVSFSYRVSDGIKTDEQEIPFIDTETDEQKTPSLIDISGHWAQKNIEELVASGAVGGYADNTFKPNNTVTRAEFAAMLVKALKLEGKNGTDFADTSNHWAKEYIAIAASNGIVNGLGADTFAPDALITREQMAVMISKAVQLVPATEDIEFADSDSISEWARKAIVDNVANGILKGYYDNTIRPQSNTTRAEAATVIVSAMRQLPEN